MKKTIFFILIGFIFTGSIGGIVYATVQREIYKAKIVQCNELMKNAKIKEAQKDISDLIDATELDARIANEKNGFDLQQLLRHKGYYEDDIEITIQKFIDVSINYHMTKEESAYILSLVELDYDLEKLIDIYEFLQYTNDGIDMIKPIYDFSENQFEADFWIENAYATITHTENNALTQEEVMGYIEKGVSLDDILLIYQMGLQSNMTERQIIQERLRGVSWSEISAKVYDDIELLNILPKDIELEQINEYVSYSRILGQKPSEILERKEFDVKIRADAAEKINKKNEEIFKATLKYDTEDSVILKSAIKEIPQLDDNSIHKLLRDGYRIKDIKKALDGSLDSKESREIYSILNIIEREDNTR